MKTATIQVRMTNNVMRPETAKAIIGAFALVGERGEWRVTHISTGLMLGKFERKSDALRWMRELRHCNADFNGIYQRATEGKSTNGDREVITGLWHKVLNKFNGDV